MLNSSVASRLAYNRIASSSVDRFQKETSSRRVHCPSTISQTSSFSLCFVTSSAVNFCELGYEDKGAPAASANVVEVSSEAEEGVEDEGAGKDEGVEE